jgi:hypothetical protein
MNERIKALAKQAGIDIRHIENHADEKFADNLEKLAELIVRECIRIDDDTGYTLWPEETTTTGTKIAEYFGVTE